jgi:hypothetical protein
MPPWPRGTLGIVSVVSAAGLAALVAFHRPSQAQPEQGSTALPVDSVRSAIMWEPSVVNAPGLPLQCSDGTWTRTAVRGGCARHGGVTY